MSTIKEAYSKYTPVVIQFVPGVLTEQQSENDLIKVPGVPNRLRIHTPVSRDKAFIQTIQKPLSVLIPSTGLVRLQLYPSDQYVPYGRYRVEYLVSGESYPIREEKWIVPSITCSASIMVTHTGLPQGDEIRSQEGYSIWTLDSVGHTGQYELVNGRIRWNSNPPQVDEQYLVYYKPALTLGHLIENKEHRT